VLKGTVKWFSEESGYGFIRPNEDGENVFVRRMRRVGSGFEALEKGAKVAYEVSQHEYGASWATKVAKVAT
jgi:CspA family cold shock protein